MNNKIIKLINFINTFSLPHCNQTEAKNLVTELLRETSYNIDALTRHIEENHPKLLPDQKSAFSTVIDQVRNRRGGIYFLDAPGGTGKTFVTNHLLDKVR